MVLAQKVGQKRSFGLGLLLTIVTFGIYAIFWNYKAHNELYRQFELEREDRDEGMVWYVLGLTLQPLLVAYLWIFASNVDYLRQRIGLPRKMTPGKFVALAGTGVGIIAGATILLVVASFGVPENATQEETAAAIGAVSDAFLALLATGGVLVAIAYAGLQKDINELWDAYDARIAYLSRHPEEIAPRSPYMADLAQTTTTSRLAAPLQGEVARLRERHPSLRALAQLDELVAQADQGDAHARERGEVLLGDLATALQERAELLRLKDERAREASSIHERIAAGTIFEQDLRTRLAQLTTEDLDERLALLDQALFARA